MTDVAEKSGAQEAGEGKPAIWGRLHLFEISGIKINIDYYSFVLFVSPGSVLVE